MNHLKYNCENVDNSKKKLRNISKWNRDNNFKKSFKEIILGIITKLIIYKAHLKEIFYEFKYSW